MTAEFLFELAVLFYLLGAVASGLWAARPRLSVCAAHLCAVVAAAFGIICGTLVLLGEAPFRISIPLLTALSDLAPSVRLFESLGLRVDALSAFFILVISLLALPVSIYALGYLREYEGKKSVALLGFFYNLFILDMILVVSADNALLFLIVWEAMSLISYFLVVFKHEKPENVHAGFVYLVMTHVGTAFLVLLFLLFYQQSGSFDFATFRGAVGSLPQITRTLAFVFALIGFGTKAGLAPMHTWLPDAHSQAPTPISALLSGVLINAAMYGILRFHHLLAVSSVGPDFSSTLLLVFGLFSLSIAVPFILVQKDYKRLLAYSSVEHMGLIATGIGLGTPLAIYAALLHTFNHALAKALIFMSAGNVLLKFKTKEILLVKGVVKVMPATGSLLLLGVLAITGLPPFNLFISEFLILSASFAGQKPLVGALILLFVVVAFAGFVYSFSHMAFGTPREDVRCGEGNPSSLIPLSIVMGLVLLLGLYIPGPLHQLLQQAAKLVRPV